MNKKNEHGGYEIQLLATPSGVLWMLVGPGEDDQDELLVWGRSWSVEHALDAAHESLRQRSC
jgi:hypothetical protein